MNIRDLEYIVAVATRCHFGQAAKDCNVSQPALSGQIKKLEEQLGVTLFERSNRRVQVTRIGEEIVEDARKILKIVDGIEEKASSRTDPLTGKMKLGMIPTIGPYLAPLLLPSVSHGLPKLEIEISENMTSVLESQLLGGKIDVALVATAPENENFEEIPLYQEPFWIALPHGHVLERQEVIDLSDIRSDDLLLLGDGHCLRDQVLALYSQDQEEPPHIATQQTSLTTVLALVGAGAGVTLVPAMSLRGPWVTDSGIAVRKEMSGRAARKVRLLFRKSYPKRAALEKLADIICAILPDTVFPERR